MQEADIAEVQYYHFQKKIDRLKAAFVGSKLAIIRIFTSLLPVAGIFLTLVKANVSEPMKPFDGNVSMLTLVNNIDAFTSDAIPSLLSGEYRTSAMFLVASLILFVVSLLALLLHFILLTLACSPKGKIRNVILDVIILLSSFGSAAAFILMPEFDVVKGSLGIGGYLYLFLQLLNVVFDFIVLKKGIPVHHKQCYCGGIPIEEYFEMVDRGMTTEEIRAIQYEKLQAIQDEKIAKLAEKEAEEAQKNG